MNIKTVLTSSLLALMITSPISAFATKTNQPPANPLAIPLQAHTVKDMWESFFNQCWSYDFVDKKELDTSLKVWQKRNANRWQVYWLLMEQAADDNAAFKTSYINFKKQSLSRAKEQAESLHSKVGDAEKKQLCERLVVMLNDPRSDLPEDKTKKTQDQNQEGVAVIGK
ncbi:hypothetical protein [Psychromonas sp. Urea-02u-13]|uniref:hypothetical protein n=1 Tax=Psychromonas sp. Urea-02u-13 TaxID=2058326 RepID=UPI000C330D98|nr:hypothetical protein [Psychromonas sp. Urea-02u-13]PKG38074.1 hypothetical protein CXF74_15420 [Psychromonas sp. Urea-02u-13]